jgi:hypothetical protein
MEVVILWKGHGDREEEDGLTFCFRRLQVSQAWAVLMRLSAGTFGRVMMAVMHHPTVHKRRVRHPTTGRVRRREEVRPGLQDESHGFRLRPLAAFSLVSGLSVLRSCKPVRIRGDCLFSFSESCRLWMRTKKTRSRLMTPRCVGGSAAAAPWRDETAQFLTSGRNVSRLKGCGRGTREDEKIWERLLIGWGAWLVK